jgi:predicted esterase
MRTAAMIAVLCLAAGAFGAADPAPETDVAPSTPKPPADAPTASTGDKTAPSPQPAHVEAADLTEARPGVIVHSHLLGSRRPFSVYVPKGYRKDAPLALLIECTGRGVARDNIGSVWKLAEQFNLVLASADTYSIFGKPTDPAEVTGSKKAWSRHGKTLDVPHVDRDREDILRDVRADAEAIGQMVDLLQKLLSIDRRLVVLTGYSGGARSAYFTGIGDPKRYAGICIRSGQFHRTVLPPRPQLARKMPIQIVIGDQDMKLVLDQTADAERYFKSLKFERFQVERLPNSGHDNRPEAAGNFVAFLRNELKQKIQAEATKQRDKYLRAGKASLERGELDKARHWLTKAATVERQHNLKPAEAQKLLETMKPSPETQQGDN